MKKPIDIPADLAKKIEDDGKATLEHLKPIKTELDKLPEGADQMETFEAVLKGVKNMLKKP